MNEMLRGFRTPSPNCFLHQYHARLRGAGRVIGKQEMVSMDKVLSAVVQNFEYAVNEGMVHFEKEGSFPEVWCDPVRMVQVWQN